MGGGRFAAAGFTGKSKDLARMDLERDIVDRDDRAARGQVLDSQSVN